MASSKYDTRTGGPWLSVLVPVYNEEATVNELLRRLRDGPYPDKEVIVVDDGSSDAVPSILLHWATVPGFIILRHPENRGKGAALRTALNQARGMISVVQDADLECDPSELPRIIEVLRDRQDLVVYGSRYLQPNPPLALSKFRVAMAGQNFLVWLLYGRRLTDEATCYKAFPTELLRRLEVTANRFDFCVEVTAKLCRLGIPIQEVAISYHPRTPTQGKKISWRDAWPPLWMLLKWRIWPLANVRLAAPMQARQSIGDLLPSSAPHHLARQHLGTDSTRGSRFPHRAEFGSTVK